MRCCSFKSWLFISIYAPHILIIQRKISHALFNSVDSSALLVQQDEAHIALAFEVPGGWRQEKEAIILTVLQVPHLFYEH